MISYSTLEKLYTPRRLGEFIMTMKTPEMEVVRFNESDVIVASGHIQSFALAKWTNGTKDDATVNGLTKNKAEEWLENLGTGHTFQYKENTPVSAASLYNYEETGTIQDGIYTKVEGENRWWCQ